MEISDWLGPVLLDLGDDPSVGWHRFISFPQLWICQIPFNRLEHLLYPTVEYIPAAHIDPADRSLGLCLLFISSQSRSSNSALLGRIDLIWRYIAAMGRLSASLRSCGKHFFGFHSSPSDVQSKVILHCLRSVFILSLALCRLLSSRPSFVYPKSTSLSPLLFAGRTAV